MDVPSLGLPTLFRSVNATFCALFNSFPNKKKWQQYLNNYRHISNELRFNVHSIWKEVNLIHIDVHVMRETNKYTIYTALASIFINDWKKRSQRSNANILRFRNTRKETTPYCSVRVGYEAASHSKSIWQEFLHLPKAFWSQGTYRATKKLRLQMLFTANILLWIFFCSSYNKAIKRLI